jgi:hypothetical protein
MTRKTFLWDWGLFHNDHLAKTNANTSSKLKFQKNTIRKRAVVTFAKKITEFQDKIIDIAISGIMAHLQKK